MCCSLKSCSFLTALIGVLVYIGLQPVTVHVNSAILIKSDAPMVYAFFLYPVQLFEKHPLIHEVDSVSSMKHPDTGAEHMQFVVKRSVDYLGNITYPMNATLYREQQKIEYSSAPSIYGLLHFSALDIVTLHPTPEGISLHYNSTVVVPIALKYHIEDECQKASDDFLRNIKQFIELRK